MDNKELIEELKLSADDLNKSNLSAYARDIEKAVKALESSTSELLHSAAKLRYLQGLFLQMYELGSYDPTIEGEVESAVAFITTCQSLEEEARYGQKK